MEGSQKLLHLLTYKTVNKKNGKLMDKIAEEIPCNKFCAYLIGPYKMCRKENDADLLLKPITMIDLVTG